MVRGEARMSHPPEARSLPELDETDFALIRYLQDDGRISNAQLARNVGISEPTVRKRIDRMVRDEVIRPTAILNPRKTGYTCDVIIGLCTQPGRMVEVGEQLVAYDQVVYLGYTTGRYDLLVEMLFRDDAELLTFLEKEMGQVSGVVSMETSHVLRAERNDYDLRLSPQLGSQRVVDHRGHST